MTVACVSMFSSCAGVREQTVGGSNSPFHLGRQQYCQAVMGATVPGSAASPTGWGKHQSSHPTNAGWKLGFNQARTVQLTFADLNGDIKAIKNLWS